MGEMSFPDSLRLAGVLFVLIIPMPFGISSRLDRIEDRTSQLERPAREETRP